MNPNPLRFQRFFLFAFVSILAFQRFSVFSQTNTINVTWSFGDFVSNPLNVSLVTVSNLSHNIVFNGKILSTSPKLCSRAQYPTLTNGTLTLSNMIPGYAYAVTFADAYSVNRITNYFGTNVSGDVDGYYYTQNLGTNAYYSQAQIDALIAAIATGAGITNIMATNAGDVTVSGRTAFIPTNAPANTNALTADQANRLEMALTNLDIGTITNSVWAAFTNTINSQLALYGGGNLPGWSMLGTNILSGFLPASTYNSAWGALGTNQFLGAGSGGYRDAGNVTNVPFASVTGVPAYVLMGSSTNSGDIYFGGNIFASAAIHGTAFVGDISGGTGLTDSQIPALELRTNGNGSALTGINATNITFQVGNTNPSAALVFAPDGNGGLTVKTNGGGGSGGGGNVYSNTATIFSALNITGGENSSNVFGGTTYGTFNGSLAGNAATATTAGTATNFPVNKTLWVDPLNGSDVTGQRGNQAKPFKTIGFWQSFSDFPSGTPFAYTTPTGALSVAVGGDLIRVAPGTNWIWAVQLWHPGRTHNGVSLIGAGEGITFLVETNCNDGSVPVQPATLGPLIQPGNNSRVGGFTYISADPTGSLGPDGFGLNGFGNLTYTNEYPGFTNAVMFNISGTPHNVAFDGLYFTSRTNCILTCRNLHIYDYYDGYAVYPEITNPNYYVEMFDCIFAGGDNGPDRPLMSTIENISINVGSGRVGTNIFYNCAFKTYANTLGTFAAYGLNILTINTNSLILLDNCTFEKHDTNAGSSGIYCQSSLVQQRVSVIGGNPTVTGTGVPFGYWFNPATSNLTATSFAGNASGVTNVQASGISPAGGTAGQILLNTGTTTVWTNDQSIVQAGSYEFVSSTTNPVTGQITYTVTGVNTNQFLGARSGGYRDAGNVTNVPFASVTGVPAYVLMGSSTNSGDIYFGGNIFASAAIHGTAFVGDISGGTGLTDSQIPASLLRTNGNAAALTGLNGANLTANTVNSNALDAATLAGLWSGAAASRYVFAGYGSPSTIGGNSVRYFPLNGPSGSGGSSAAALTAGGLPLQPPFTITNLLFGIYNNVLTSTTNLVTRTFTNGVLCGNLSATLTGNQTIQFTSDLTGYCTVTGSSWTNAFVLQVSNTAAGGVGLPQLWWSFQVVK